MMKYIACSFLLIIIFSCRSNIISKDKLSGTFYNKGVDFEYTLVLNKNGTFVLKEVFYQHGQSTCEGVWHFEESNNETLVLKCSEVKNPIETLSNRYMSKRDYMVKIISFSDLRLDEIVLKRVK